MDEKRLTHIDLFSGIGGFTLAAEWAGFKTIAFCEKEKFCQKVLQERFGAVITDSKHLRKLQSERGKQDIRKWSGNIPIIPEIRDFDGTKYRGATLLTGGFPCQPFSVAGKQKGEKDDRYLWPEMLRIISEAKPRWILAENVPGIFRMALDTVLSDLESKDYATGTFIIPACGLNAPHRRNRVWIIAYSKIRRMQGRSISIRPRQSQEATCNIKRCYQNAPDSTRRRQRESLSERKKKIDPCKGDKWNLWQENWLDVATQLCRMDDGISDRFHRLRALGNAIVPQIAYEILKNIAWIENENN